MFIELNFAPEFLEDGRFGYSCADFANAKELIRVKDIKKCFIWMVGDKAFVAVDVFPLNNEGTKLKRYCYHPFRPDNPAWSLDNAKQHFYQLSKMLTRNK